MSSQNDLDAIAKEISVCKRCQLHSGRKHTVPGEGPATAAIMLIGEGPGFHENEQGRPFVGAAGKFLEELLGCAKLKRSDVFIGNVVKCRPPGNRDPEPAELQACAAFLERQIQAIQPKVIVTLGRFSMAHFLPDAKISGIHGQARQVNGRLVVAMYHPAAALHQPKFKQPLIEDFGKLPALISQAGPRPPEAPEAPEATQLSLF
jgi:uracil-DNA glycosylase